MGIEVKGLKRLERNLRGLQTFFDEGMQDFLGEVATDLRDMSINTLNSYSRNPISISDNQPIRDKANWSIETEKDKAVLTSLSPHSQVVEYGSTNANKIIKAYEYGYFGGWPTGKSQGYTPIYKDAIRIQGGHHFISNTLQSQEFANSIQQNFDRRIKAFIH